MILGPLSAGPRRPSKALGKVPATVSTPRIGVLEVVEVGLRAGMIFIRRWDR